MVDVIQSFSSQNTGLGSIGGFNQGINFKPRKMTGPSSPILPSLKYSEMSPEVTLIEFISTSASFHGIRKQSIKHLEWDIVKVFPNNVMPANAAAWFMAKRKYYLENVYEYQLLPTLLSRYPKKFAIKGSSVEFLETYDKEVARKKLQSMVRQGIVAYFSHKVEEYGVYFFDPYYYENTEPFHANLRCVTNCYKGHRVKLVPNFFEMYSNTFVFQKHSPYLVTISKEPVEVVTNVTGVIVSMVDNQFGILQFPSTVTGSTEKAFFSAKALFKDGFVYQGDPMKLPPVEFDGYHVPIAKGSKREHSWYAVLVWTGRKPSPKFCSTREDLTSSPYFQNQTVEEIVAKTTRGIDGGTPLHDCMQVGEVLEIHKDGAVVSLRKDSEDKAFIPGWSHRNTKTKNVNFLMTTQGVELAHKDLIAFYIDPNQKSDKYKAVGCNVMVLKHAAVGNQSTGAQNARRRSSSGAPVEHLGAVSGNEEGGSQNKMKRNKKRSRKNSAKSGGTGKDASGDKNKKGSDGIEEKDAGKASEPKSKGPPKPPRSGYAQFILKEDLETDSYDSDVDPGFMPPVIPDPEFDFDEYSDGEINEEEVKDLMREAKEDVDVEDLKKKLEEFEEMKKVQNTAEEPSSKREDDEQEEDSVEDKDKAESNEKEDPAAAAGSQADEAAADKDEESTDPTSVPAAVNDQGDN